MSKVKIGLIGFVGLFIASMAVVSCKKQVETEVRGKWMKQAYINSNDADSAIWTFADNGTLYIENLTDSTWSDTGKYVVVEKNLKNYIRIVELRDYLDHQRLNGDWRVVQYKKDRLTITKGDFSINSGAPSGNILREFMRMQ